LAAKTRAWSKLPLQGTLPRVSADEHGMAYDSKRDRLPIAARTLVANGGEIVPRDEVRTYFPSPRNST
jgi:hypothetical protein